MYTTLGCTYAESSVNYQTLNSAYQNGKNDKINIYLLNQPFSIQVRNHTAAPLNDIPMAQAPALFVTTNDKDVVSAVVVFDGDCLYTLSKPRAYECAALLLAGYIVYQIEYPAPYKKQLCALQHILHGEKGCIDIGVRNFFRTFFAAIKLSSHISS